MVGGLGGREVKGSRQAAVSVSEKISTRFNYKQWAHSLCLWTAQHPSSVLEQASLIETPHQGSPHASGKGKLGKELDIILKLSVSCEMHGHHHQKQKLSPLLWFSTTIRVSEVYYLYVCIQMQTSVCKHVCIQHATCCKFAKPHCPLRHNYLSDWNAPLEGRSEFSVSWVAALLSAIMIWMLARQRMHVAQV